MQTTEVTLTVEVGRDLLKEHQATHRFSKVNRELGFDATQSGTKRPEKAQSEKCPDIPQNLSSGTSIAATFSHSALMI